ncbi:hypothetical protein B0H17DRAFT_1053930, partial [Mycena rosella]
MRVSGRSSRDTPSCSRRCLCVRTRTSVAFCRPSLMSSSPAGVAPCASRRVQGASQFISADGLSTPLV